MTKIMKQAIIDAAMIKGYTIKGNTGAISVYNNNWLVLSWGPCMGVNLLDNIHTIDRLQNVAEFTKEVLRQQARLTVYDKRTKSVAQERDNG